MKVWAKGQGAVSTSSMEAELYAAVFGTMEMRLLQSLAQYLGAAMTARLLVDSTAATVSMRREGLGKAKHVEIQWLWVQQETRSGRAVVVHVPGVSNPADMFTKPLGDKDLQRHVRKLGCDIIEYEEGS